MEDKRIVNTFVNDGSFMEMFKKKMEQEKLGCGSAEGGSGRSTTAASATTTTSRTDESSKTLGTSPQNARTDGQAGRENDQTESVLLTESREDGFHRLPTQSESVQNAATKDSKKSKSDEKRSMPVTDEQLTRESDKPAVISAPAQKKYSLLSHVGKRRDGKVSLKTGAVKKLRKNEAEDSKNPGSWSKYMAEVQKYKAHVCGDEDKSRPLVK